MQIKFKCKEFEIFLWKKDAFNCVGIRLVRTEDRSTNKVRARNGTTPEGVTQGNKP